MTSPTAPDPHRSLKFHCLVYNPDNGRVELLYADPFAEITHDDTSNLACVLSINDVLQRKRARADAELSTSWEVAGLETYKTYESFVSEGVANPEDLPKFSKELAIESYLTAKKIQLRVNELPALAQSDSAMANPPAVYEHPLPPAKINVPRAGLFDSWVFVRLCRQHGEDGIPLQQPPVALFGTLKMERLQGAPQNYEHDDGYALLTQPQVAALFQSAIIRGENVQPLAAAANAFKDYGLGANNAHNRRNLVFFSPERGLEAHQKAREIIRTSLGQEKIVRAAFGMINNQLNRPQAFGR